MKKRLEKLEDQQPAPDPEKVLISCGTSWLNATRNGNNETAMKARQKAEKYFNKLPEYREKTPFCSKVLFIEWDWFVGWLNEDTREFYKRCQQEGKTPNHQAQIENFNPKN